MTDDYRRSADTKVHWGTPDSVLERVRLVGPIGLDPCSNPAAQRHVKARMAFFGPPLDGLVLPWSEQLQPEELVYANPPYGRHLVPWSEKMIQEVRAGTTIITLVPASTGTRWWRVLLTASRCVCFWHGRLKFIDCAADPAFEDFSANPDLWGVRPAEPKTVAGSTFDSAVLFLSIGRAPWRFAEAFQDVGDLWFPSEQGHM